MSQNPIQDIAKLLEEKCSSKQRTFTNLEAAFEQIYKESTHILETLKAEISDKADPMVKLEIARVSEVEFQIKIAGDMLVFLLHTNIVTLDPEHGVNKSPYVIEMPERKYLGQINVYNFMADSLKYNRLNDPGYLLGRMFVNCENHFLVEGDGQLGYMFNDISQHTLDTADISIFVQLLIVRAVESDLVSPPFPKLRSITLNQKLGMTSAMGMGQKIGFQMSYEGKAPE
jgi:hypothetical protein